MSAPIAPAPAYDAGYKHEHDSYAPDTESMAMDEKKVEVPQDAFGDEEFAEVKYKVLKWWYV